MFSRKNHIRLIKTTENRYITIREQSTTVPSFEEKTLMLLHVISKILLLMNYKGHMTTMAATSTSRCDKRIPADGILKQMVPSEILGSNNCISEIESSSKFLN